MKILIADDSPISTRMMEFLVESTGHECCIVHDGESAWELISTGEAPRIMFLHWVMPGIDGLDLCRKIRDLKLPYYVYIVIISSRQRPGDLRLGYQAGADDFVTKPFRRQDILSRIRAAERVVQALSPAGSFQDALHEACDDGAGGDIIVRSGRVVGRIMIHHGRVAWAHISNETSSLHAVLDSGEAPVLDKEVIREVLQECTVTGRNFAEVIVDWSLMDADTLRERVRRWLRDRIIAIGELPTPTLVFTPEERSYGDGLLFDIAEVFPPHLLLPARVQDARKESLAGPLVVLGQESIESMQDTLDRVLAIDGALSVAIFDSDTGETLMSRGELGDHEIGWHNLKLAASVEAADPVEDIIINTHHHVHILRVYSTPPLRFISVTASRPDVRLGMLRLALADCCPSATTEG